MAYLETYLKAPTLGVGTMLLGHGGWRLELLLGIQRDVPVPNNNHADIKQAQLEVAKSLRKQKDPLSVHVLLVVKSEKSLGRGRFRWDLQTF